MEDPISIQVSTAIEKSNKLGEDFYIINEKRSEIYEKMLSLQLRVSGLHEKVKQRKQ